MTYVPKSRHLKETIPKFFKKRVLVAFVRTWCFIVSLSEKHMHLRGKSYP